MFKILVTTRYGEAIHTVVIEFGSRPAAELGLQVINTPNQSRSYNQNAIALYE